MGFEEIISGLSTNPYFGAGFGLVGVGAGLTVLRRALILSATLVRRQAFVTLEVPCSDKSYFWLLQWITNQARNTQHLSVETYYQQLETGRISCHFDFVPSPGIHFFSYRGRWFRIERKREQMVNLNMGTPWESVSLTTYGRDKLIYLNILEEARELALRSYEGKTLMYTAMGHEWKQFGSARKRRPLSSVILNGNISEDIVGDVREFIASSAWYHQRGIPYRRGYLLYGPPGSGKTSYITALAGELEYSICILNLSDKLLTDDRLNHLMNVIPEQSIVLLEDVDAAFTSREENDGSNIAYKGINRLTFSGLLNMLDGVASTEARILFMTTNYLERLDPALIRPGRVDRKYFIGPASDRQLYRAFLRFYPESDSETINSFIEMVRSTTNEVSMATIQGHFMRYKNDRQSAVKNPIEVEDCKVKLAL